MGTLVSHRGGAWGASGMQLGPPEPMGEIPALFGGALDPKSHKGRPGPSWGALNPNGTPLTYGRTLGGAGMHWVPNTQQDPPPTPTHRVPFRAVVTRGSFSPRWSRNASGAGLAFLSSVPTWALWGGRGVGCPISGVLSPSMGWEPHKWGGRGVGCPISGVGEGLGAP